MKLVATLSLVLLTSLVLPAGCASTGQRDQSRTSRNSVNNQSGLVRHPYELSKKAKHFSVALTVHASEGDFFYSLVDPHGTPTWEGRVGVGKGLTETRPFKLVPGKWVLTMNMENATGNYEIGWKVE